MRQAGGAEHQREAEGEGRDRVLHQAAGAHDRLAFRVDLDGFGEQGADVEVDVLEHHDRHEGRAGQQQHGLDDLYPGGRQHAAEQHVEDHQDADQDHRDVVVQAEQQLDQLAGADHLRDQVEGHHHQRTAGGQGADLRLPEAVGGDVGEGVLAEVAQAFGDQEEDHRPAHQEADGVDQAVVAGGEHQGGNTQEGRGGHVVAGDRQAVLEAGDAAAGGIEVGGRLAALGGPVGDAQGEQDETDEHDDGGNVHRLALHIPGEGVGPEGRSEGSQPESGEQASDHCWASLRICWLRLSNSPLARRT
ncbi:hypothetical protein D9M71_365210 [compost metagenome]